MFTKRALILPFILFFCCELAARDELELGEPQQRTIEKGIAWLLKARNRDGGWGLDARDGRSDITCTALAGLALLSAGVTEREGHSSQAVAALRGAAQYVLQHARRASADIAMGQVTLIQNKLGNTVHNHFAVVFLSQLYGMRSSNDELEINAELGPILEKLTGFIARAQEPDGSWHKQTFGSLKATCMAWLALRAASSVHIPIKHAAVSKTVSFIEAQYNGSTQLYDAGGTMQGYQAMYATASSVRVLMGMGRGGEKNCRTAADAFIDQCQKGNWKRMFLTVEGEDYLASAMFSHALVHENDERWRKWYGYLSDQLMKRQNADGSWTTTACIRGTTFPTACAIMALNTPNRLLPLQDF